MGGNPGTPPLPDPHGRSWLHPSELPPPVVAPRRRHRWTIPATAGVAGALAFVGAVALLDTGSGTRRPEDGAAVADQVVSIVAWTGPMARYGSAVVAEPGVLLTSAALVTDASGLEMVTPGGGRLPVRLVGVDRARGLAVMECEEEWVAPPVTPPTALAQEGQSLLFVTAGTALPAPMHATVTQLGRLIEMDRRVPPGHEGAALMGSSGRLVGLVVHLGGDGSGARVVPMTAVDRIVAEMMERATMVPDE